MMPYGLPTDSSPGYTSGHRNDCGFKNKSVLIYSMQFCADELVVGADRIIDEMIFKCTHTTVRALS